MMNASQAWSAHYDREHAPSRYCPENFVVRVLCSNAPVCFLPDKAFSGRRVLDLGCGHGRHIPLLSDLGFEVMGLEVSDPLVEHLRRTFPDARFVRGRNAAIPLKDGSLDMILAVNAIYYLDDPATAIAAVMAEAARVLKPGGALVCSFVGHRHSILDHAERVGDAAVIRNDALGFRNGTALRPLWENERLADVLTPFAFHRGGHIFETAEGHRRHLHYAVAFKPS